MKQLPWLLLSRHFFFFLLLVAYTYPHLTTSKAHNNVTDLESLLAFKDHVTDPHGILAASWTTNVSFCSWVGVRCSLRRQRVVALDLRSVSLLGSISPRISNLSFLSYLYLMNTTLSGPVPYGIGRLPRLKELNLYPNHLSGRIPSSIFNMSSLVRISLSSNNLIGPLPSDDHILLPQLQWISLSKNNLTGRIPAGFGRCANLQVLSMTSNAFSGSIPAELGNATRLNGIYLGENRLTGLIPASIGNLTSLNVLEFGFNYLEGPIPEDLGNLPSLQYLNTIDNSLTGSIPMSLLNASQLSFLQLAGNELTGPIPDQIGKSLPLLRIFSLSTNELTGGLEFITSLSNCRNLEGLVVAANRLEGILPKSVENLSDHLLYLEVEQNRIWGEIPTGIGNLSSLLTLNLGENEMGGVIPSVLAALKRLQGMDLGGNNLTGSIPFDIGQMRGLNILYLGQNALSGRIPDSIGNISGLQHLSLSTNNLFSRIPDSIGRLVGLLSLYLSENSLYSSLPPQFADLTSLFRLDLSKNSLSGNISTVQWDLQMLTYLDLSNNLFHGYIPQSLGHLININYMNLSHNNFSGNIPKALANLSHLTSIDLSFNKLEGQIPEGRVFSNVSIPTLIGNTGLCGAVTLGFSPCPSTAIRHISKSKFYLVKYILPPTAFVAILLSCLYLFLKFGRKRTETKSSSEETPVNQFRVVSYNELVRATENFNDTNLLGKGSIGTVYKAHLDDGLVVAVKVIKLNVQDALRHFDAELRALSMVRHRNLVKIISTCSNLDFKGLILQFMPNGSLEKCLYNHYPYLNLCQRISILVDVSLALEYLHHEHPHVILHRDLKPSNVLLDENMIAHVGDFGIAKLLLDDSNSISASRPGTIGYMAPEYGSTGKFSRKGDVYSFGILVLETFTGKKPSDAMFCEGLTLRQWVSEAYPSDMLRLVDCNLLRDDSAEQQMEDLNHALQCVSSVIELGLLCSRDSAKERILMKEVVPIIQKIKVDYLSKLSESPSA